MAVSRVLRLVLGLCFIAQSYAMIEGLYCGLENCYDVLGVTRESNRKEIAKAYRSLARKHHPDRQQTSEGKAEAEIKFRQIATAYETLSNEDSRQDYDYLLDNPEEMYSHYYRYYARRMSPKVDVRIVLLVTISVISAFQYYAAWCRYDSAIRYTATIPKYRLMALEFAKEEGLNQDGSTSSSESKGRGKNKVKGKSKEELRREEEELVRKIVAEKLDIRGGFAKPSIYDILWLQIICFPWNLCCFLCFHLNWFWRFGVRRQEYEEADKMYLIRYHMGMNQVKFETSFTDEEQEEFLKLELWDKETYKAWKEEKDEEERRKLMENSRYKSYRRYVKQHGVPRMTFDDD